MLREISEYDRITKFRLSTFDQRLASKFDTNLLVLDTVAESSCMTQGKNATLRSRAGEWYSKSRALWFVVL